MDHGPTTWTGRLAASAAVAALRAEGVRFAPAHPERLVHLDTFDGLLHRAGCRLEWRSGTTNALALSAEGSPAAHLPAETMPRFATDLPPGPLRSRLQKIIDVRALLPLVDLSSTVAVGTHVDRSGKTTATVVLRRRPKLAEGGTRLPTWTIEVRPLVGYPKPAQRIAETLESIGLQRHDGDTLSLALAVSGVDPAGVSMSPTVPLDPAIPATTGVCMVLLHLLDAMQVNWQGTIDDIDPEFLHDLRVAVRRARSVLAQASGVVPDAERDEARTVFGGLGEITGPSRDLDVFVIEWDGYLAPLAPDTRSLLGPALDLIQEHRAAAHAELAGALRRAADDGLVDQWRQRIRGWDAGTAADDGSTVTPRLGPFVARRIRKAQRRLVRNGRLITAESPAEALHDLRKDAKRLRYLIECFGGVLEPSRRKDFVGHLKALQDNLGEHQDAEVHVASLRGFGHELERRGAGADTLLALGQLTELLEQRRLAARAEFADRFTGYDTKETRSSLAALLDGLTPPDPDPADDDETEPAG
jgi:CHAD domain-containing protein